MTQNSEKLSCMYSSRESFVSKKNECNSICRKSKIKYFKTTTEKGISSSK